jgi:predicted cupin superfamily sugar epimerase
MSIDLRDKDTTAMQVRAALNLAPHPEGGHYREIWRDSPQDGTRGAATTILFLLEAGERSHWHRVDAAELWLWQGGATLELGIGQETIRLGPDLAAGDQLQAVVPAQAWQAARPLGAWSLVGCVVAPAFRFEGFELAPPGWAPPAG